METKPTINPLFNKLTLVFISWCMVPHLWAIETSRIAVFNTAGKLNKCDLVIFNPTSVPQKIDQLNAKIFNQGQYIDASAQAQIPGANFSALTIPLTVPPGQTIRILFDFTTISEQSRRNERVSAGYFAFGGTFKIRDDGAENKTVGMVISSMQCFRKDGFKKTGSYLIPLMGGTPF